MGSAVHDLKVMIPTNIPKGGFLIIGFLIMAGVSTVLTFKQARVVDAMGDIASVQAEINELQLEAQQSDDDDINKYEIKELREEDLPEQTLDAQNALAAFPNGAVIWSLLSQLGAAIFGLGVISIFLKTEENERVRSIALLVIGGMVFTFIAARFIYIMIGAGSSVGGAAM